MLTRKIKPEEKTQLARFGDMEAYGAENILGLEDVVIIVHTSNPVTRLTVEQVRKIFSGEIKNWKEVGGTDTPVQVYSRPKAISGIYETFETLVLKPASLAAAAKLLDGNDKLSDAVAADPGAIGYTGLPYIRSAKAVAIATAETKPLLPNNFTIGRKITRSPAACTFISRPIRKISTLASLSPSAFRPAARRWLRRTASFRNPSPSIKHTRRAEVP